MSANKKIVCITGSVWTGDQERGVELASRLECGQVNVNDVIIVDNLMNSCEEAVQRINYDGRFRGPVTLREALERRLLEDKELRELSYETDRIAWVNSTYINEDTDWLAARAVEKTMATVCSQFEMGPWSM